MFILLYHENLCSGFPSAINTNCSNQTSVFFAETENQATLDKITHVVKVKFAKDGDKPQKPEETGNRNIYLINGDVYLDDTRKWSISKLKYEI